MEELEAFQERQHMMKSIFPLMRSWFHSSEFDPIRSKYNLPFPLFWQDLETWPYTKILTKLYLSVCERKEAGHSTIDIIELESKISSAGRNVQSEETISSDNDFVAPLKTESKLSNDIVETIPKKKRSRWGDSIEPADVVPSSDNAVVESKNETKEEHVDSTLKPRKSRWSQQDSSLQLGASVASTQPIVAAPVVAPMSQEQLQQSLVLKMQMQQVNERLLTVTQNAARIEQDPNRSPSPPPRYDSQGKRTNTRVIRMRDSLMQERSRIIDDMMKLNPVLAAPLDFMRTKPIKKIPIPASQLPNQSFIGLIIGPRGNTQKRMEQETGCKISIKGKGMRGSANLPGEEEEPLHVHISGEEEAKVEQAAAMVLELLNPKNEDSINQHKEKQLRELALINGTLREDEYCPVCGEKGHKQFECPTKMRTFKAAGVKCSICGDGSHPTRDCPLKQHTAPGEGVLDSEYDSLMSELSGGGGYSKVGASSGTTNSIGAVVNASSLQCTALKEHVYVVPEAPVKKQTVVHVAPLFIPSANPYTAQPPTLPTYGYQQGQGYPQGYTSQPVAPTPAYGHSHGQLAASSSATYYNYAYPAPSAQAWPYTANPSLTQPQLNHNQAQHIPPPLQPPPPPPPL